MALGKWYVLEAFTLLQFLNSLLSENKSELTCLNFPPFFRWIGYVCANCAGGVQGCGRTCFWQSVHWTVSLSITCFFTLCLSQSYTNVMIIAYVSLDFLLEIQKKKEKYMDVILSVNSLYKAAVAQSKAAYTALGRRQDNSLCVSVCFYRISCSSKIAFYC